ncbi:MAG: lipopolysaccharide biosynthesis protein [Candidatus Altiarchaeota archaeon]
MSLKSKTVSGLFWVALSSTLVRVARVGTSIVLAWILVPEDFGLIAIGLLATDMLILFRDMGFGQALIHRKKDIKEAANTTFMMLLINGIVFTLLAWFLSPAIADFFNEPRATAVIQLLSITIFTTAIGTVPYSLLDKELSFKKKFIPEVVPIVAYALIAVVLAWIGWGYWSMVAGKIISAFIWLGITYYVSPFRPDFSFNFKIAKELFSYGKHILGAFLLLLLATKLDVAFIGKFLGTTALGYYTLAYFIANLPALNISQVVNRVMFPAYSKIADLKGKLSDAYLLTVKYVALISIPISVAIFILAPEVVHSVLGEKWIPATSALRVLAVFGLFRAVSSSMGELFKAMGRPEILEKLILFQVVFFLLIIYPISQVFEDGITGVGWAVTIPIFFVTAIGFKISTSMLDITFSQLAQTFSTSILAAAFMSACILTVKYTVFPAPTIIGFMIEVFVGSLAYVLALLIIERPLIGEIRGIIGK